MNTLATQQLMIYHLSLTYFTLMLFEVFLAPSVKGKIIVELTIALSSDRNVYVHLEGLFFRKILILVTLPIITVFPHNLYPIPLIRLLFSLTYHRD